jgi:hypothetical protein
MIEVRHRRYRIHPLVERCWGTSGRVTRLVVFGLWRWASEMINSSSHLQDAMVWLELQACFAKEYGASAVLSRAFSFPASRPRGCGQLPLRRTRRQDTWACGRSSLSAAATATRGCGGRSLQTPVGLPRQPGTECTSQASSRGDRSKPCQLSAPVSDASASIIASGRACRPRQPLCPRHGAVSAGSSTNCPSQPLRPLGGAYALASVVRPATVDATPIEWMFLSVSYPEHREMPSSRFD